MSETKEYAKTYAKTYIKAYYESIKYIIGEHRVAALMLQFFF